MNTIGQNEENQLEPNSNCFSGLYFEVRAKVHISRELMIAILPIIGLILVKLPN